MHLVFNNAGVGAGKTAWKFQSFRGYIRTITILWGVFYTIEFLIRLAMIYTIEFLIRLAMIYTLTISQVLLFSSIIFYALTILASVLTFRLGARLRKRSTQRNSPEAE